MSPYTMPRAPSAGPRGSPLFTFIAAKIDGRKIIESALVSDPYLFRNNSLRSVKHYKATGECKDSL